MSESKLPTIKEMARRLKISPASVSRALNGHSCIGLGTRLRVQQLARELNYVPNPNAIFFKQRKTAIIGVLLPNLREDFFAEAISGIEDIASQHKYHVIIAQSHDDVERERQAILSMKNQRVDGIIVSLAKHTRDYSPFQGLNEFGIPVVYFDRVPDMREAHKITFDMKRGTTEALEFLFSKGHRRIGILNGPEEMISTRERTEAYKSLLIKKRIKIDLSLVLSTNMTKESTYQAMTEMMRCRPAPTAVLAINDYVALDVMQFAKDKQLSVNKDLAVISYANLPIINYLETPPLASLEQFPYVLGARSADLMMELLQNPDPLTEAWQHIVINGKLIVHQDSRRQPAMKMT